MLVIYWANYKQKQRISIYNNKNGLITACILACIVYVLFDCNYNHINRIRNSLLLKSLRILED